ncbi:hypothetical protein [Natrinema hispanicum]|nr:hypothetical protein [Natrinema hispanicum]
MVRRFDPAVRVRAVGPSKVPIRVHVATSTATAGVDPDDHTEVGDR